MAPSPSQPDTTPIHNSSLMPASEDELLCVSEEIAVQHELFRMVVALAPVGIAILGGAEHRFLSVNPAYRPFVSGKDDILGRTVAEVFPEVSDTVVPLLDQVYQSGEAYSAVDLPLTLRHNGQGEETFISFRYAPWHNAQGEIQGVLVLATDTTERKRVEEALQCREAELQTIIEHLSEGLLVATIDGEVMQWNRAAVAMYGFANREDVPSHLPDLATIFELSTIDGTVLPLEDWPMARLLRGESVTQWELRIRRFHTGWQRIFQYEGSLVRDMNNQPLMGVITVQDVTEQKLAEKLLYFQATHDHLTGLPNRFLFLENLTNAIKAARRAHQPMAVLLLDLDHFKAINDAFGHAVGDQVLQTVATRLTDALRECDTIARLGGDEFTLLLTGMTEKDEVTSVATRILTTVAQPIIIAGNNCDVTASVGMSLYPEQGTDVETLLAGADRAMYHAKDSRNCYRLCNEG